MGTKSVKKPAGRRSPRPANEGAAGGDPAAPGRPGVDAPAEADSAHPGGVEPTAPILGDTEASIATGPAPPSGGDEPEGGDGSIAPVPGPGGGARKAGKRRRKDAPAPEVATDGGAAHPHSPAGGDRRLEAELDVLATEFLSVFSALGNILMEASERKVRLGELLGQARDFCRGKRGAWSGFLETLGLSDRTAREAIQFYESRDEIEEFRRHGGAGLTVTAIRAKLAKAGRGEPSGPPGVEANPSPAAPRALPRPDDPAGSTGGDVMVHAPGVPTASENPTPRVEDLGSRPAAITHSMLDPVVPDPPAHEAVDQRGLRMSAYDINSFSDLIEKFLAEQISRMESGEKESALADLKRASLKVLTCFRRLQAAIQGSQGRVE